jgi:protein tyrosine phosphatase (PTP) superfamily phosphohydrolase (DUF442 family)
MTAKGVEAILNFVQVDEDVGTAGQPTPEQFADIRGAGYEVVVNLAMPNSTNALPNEAQLVAEQGMDYVHIPVVWENPTEEDFNRFCSVMTKCQGQKTFVHCALNWRVSCFVLLYRVIHLDIPLETAAETQRAVWEPNQVWQEFIARVLGRHAISSE